MKALQALLAFLTLVLLLGGVPALLLAWGDPVSLLQVYWPGALMRPDDGTIVLGVLSVAGWLAWVVIAVTTVTELISCLSRQRIRIHLPGISWLQPAVGALVVIALSPVLSSQADEPTPPPITLAPLEVAPTTAATQPSLRQESPTTRGHVVQVGDELWGIAERELGDGTQWRSIVAHNPGMTADTVLMPGDVIQLPGSPRQAVNDVPTDSSIVTVERDDTLWELAEEHLGDAHRWPEIFAANRDVVADPDMIDIGWQLEVPRATSDPSGPTTADSSSPRNSETPPTPTDAEEPGPQTLAPSSESTASMQQETSSPHLSPTAVTPTDDDAMVPSPPAATIAANSPSESEKPATPVLDELSGSSSGTSLDLLGPLGGVLAASVVVGIVARRRVQLLRRGVGSRVTPLPPSLRQFFTGLVHRSRSAPENPPELSATSVVVGWNEDGDVHIGLEQARCTLITGTDVHTAGMTAAILTSLLCADWSSGVEVVSVQPDKEWASALDDPRLSGEESPDAALVDLQRLCAQRRLQLGHETLGDVRGDPDRADMWVPTVFIFHRALQPSHIARVRDCLSLGPVGISVVAAAQPPASPDADAPILHVDSDTRAQIGAGAVFQPQLLDEPARHAVVSLLAAAQDDRTTPAPWWRDGDEAVVTVSPDTAAGPSKDGAMSSWPTQPENPTLLLLGPVELKGCSGEPPARAMGQCIEYCAWLLLHPGSSPTAMVRELLVAETTRRSNMSRLRTWLGNDASNNPHLPDAYSGRITLAPAVSSDWERFQSLLAGGVNISSTPLLREALSLVRGTPLDGVSFQWAWTAQWLTDMTSMISDAATVLADRCLTEQDYPGALWAINQGQLATGDDETLAVRRIQVLAHTAGSTEVDAAVMQLTRAARATNSDLSADSIRRVQHALHLSMQGAASM